MASKKQHDFPVTLEHSKLKGTTRAATPAKLAHYEALGWKVKSGVDTPAAPPATTPETPSGSQSS